VRFDDAISLGPLPADVPSLVPLLDPVQAVRARGGAARLDQLGRLDERALRRALSDGSLRWGRRKVLALAEADPGLVAAVEVGGILVDAAAASYHGLAVLNPPRRPRVAIGRKTSRRELAGVTIVHRDIRPAALHSGLPVLAPLPTVVSCALALPFEEALVVANDAAFRRLLTADSLLKAARWLPERSALPLRRVARLVEPRCESLLETLHYLVLRDVGVPFELQVPLPGVGIADALLDGWLVSEADGYASHSSREHYRNDRRRVRAALLEGHPTVRWSYEDLVHNRPAVTQELRAILSRGPAGIR
jgi:hypothetical protein